MPPSRTGVADYAAALLAELRRHGRVEVAPERCDVALYHLGNNALHAAIYRRALERPGVVVLHDAVLHHFLLGQLDGVRVYRRVRLQLRRMASRRWPPICGAVAPPRLPKRAISNSPCCAASWSALWRWWFTIPRRPAWRSAPPAWSEIPHLFAPPALLPSESETSCYRRRLGIDAGAYLLGVFGYLRESKRLMSILEVFAGLHREFPRLALLVAGDFASSELERAAAPLLHSSGLVRRPFLPEREFLARRLRGGCLHQSSRSRRRRDFRRRHSSDGPGEAGPAHRFPGGFAHPGRRLHSRGARIGRTRVSPAGHTFANINQRGRRGHWRAGRAVHPRTPRSRSRRNALLGIAVRVLFLIAACGAALRGAPAVKRLARSRPHARRRSPLRQRLSAAGDRARVPALLERTPYGKGPDTHAASTRRSSITVTPWWLEDVRGRYESEGDLRPADAGACSTATTP